MYFMLLVGLVLGLATRGRLRNLANIRFGAQWALLGAGVVLVGGYVIDLGADLRWDAQRVGLGLVAVFVVGNAVTQRGALRLAFVALAIGWALNAAVIIANRAMPTPAQAFDQPEHWANGVFGAHYSDHVSLSGSVHLRALADVLEIHVAHLIVPFSIGDAFLWLGAVSLMAVGTHTPREE